MCIIGVTSMVGIVPALTDGWKPQIRGPGIGVGCWLTCVRKARANRLRPCQAALSG